MFIDDCSLCGGRVVNGRCLDCGLKTDKNRTSYREVNGVWQRQKRDTGTRILNERSATIHTRENATPVKPKPVSQSSTYQQTVYKKPVAQKAIAPKPAMPKPSRQSKSASTITKSPYFDRESSRRKRKLSPKSIRLLTIVIIGLVLNFAPDVIEFGKALYSGLVQPDQPDYVSDVDERDLTTISGETCIVGETIPPGVYSIASIEGAGYFEWKDEANGIYENGILREEEWNSGAEPFMGANNLNINSGAVIYVDTGLSVTFYLEETQLPAEQ